MIRSLAILTLVGAAHAAVADPAIPPDLAVYGKGGLQLAGATLFKGAVDSAVYDPAQELIWFKTGGLLEVIDLRDPGHAITVIAKKVPTEGWAVSGFSNVAYQTDYTNIFTIVRIEKKPKAEAGEGAYLEVNSEDDAKLTKAVKKVKIVGGKWITAQLARKPNATPKERAAPPQVKVQVPADACEDSPDECGQASWLGASPYQTVVVEHSCGDACHQSCVLYDPAKKQFAAPLAPGGWGALDKTDHGGCNGFAVDPGNTRYFTDEAPTLCTLGAKMTCTDLGAWQPFAWISAPAAPAK